MKLVGLDAFSRRGTCIDDSEMFYGARVRRGVHGQSSRFVEQIVYIINDAEDAILFVERGGRCRSSSRSICG